MSNNRRVNDARVTQRAFGAPGIPPPASVSAAVRAGRWTRTLRMASFRVTALVWPLALVLCARGVSALSRDAHLCGTGRGWQHLGFSAPPAGLWSRGRTGTALCAGRFSSRASAPHEAALRGRHRRDGAVRMQSQVETDAQPPSLQSLQHVLERANLITELRTDDGFVVTEVTTRFGDVGTRSRSNWVRALLQTFSSQVLARVSQRLTITVAWSAYISAIVLYGSELAPETWEVAQFRVPGWPHELVGGFLSILVVFRTDQAYGRYWEARRQWAAVSSICKSMARLALTNLPPQLALDFVALLAVFPTALKQHLRGQVNAQELRAIYQLYIPPEAEGVDRPRLQAMDVVLGSKNMPMTIVLTLSSLAAPLRDRPSARVFNYEFLWEELEQKMSSLTRVVSTCEKIKCTPLPLSYSRHVFLWTLVWTRIAVRDADAS